MLATLVGQKQLLVIEAIDWATHAYLPSRIHLLSESLGACYFRPLRLLLRVSLGKRF